MKRARRIHRCTIGVLAVFLRVIRTILLFFHGKLSLGAYLAPSNANFIFTSWFSSKKKEYQSPSRYILLLKLANVNSPATSLVESSQIISFPRWEFECLECPGEFWQCLKYGVLHCPLGAFQCLLQRSLVTVSVPSTRKAFQCPSQRSGVPRSNPPPSNGPLPSPLISDCRGFQAGTHGSATPRGRI